MDYAIVRLGGKQFKVSEGDTISVERQVNPVELEVLAYSEDDKITLGTPVLSNVEVKAEIVNEERVKTTVARYKSKSRYRKVKGHKQPFSIIKISKVSKKGSTKAEIKKEEVNK